MKRFGDIRKLTARGRESKKYYVRVIAESGAKTWKCTGYEDLELALAIVKRWQLDEIRGPVEVAQEMRVSQALDDWFAQATLGRAKVTVKNLRSYLKHWKALFGVCSVRQVTDLQITGYISSMLVKHKPSTINQQIKVMKQFFAWCIERGLRERSPITKHLRLPEERAVVRVLTPDEEERLLYTARLHSPRLYSYVLILVCTGFRAALAERVRWEHVDLEAGEWRIPAGLMKSRRPYTASVSERLLDWLRRLQPTAGAIVGKNTWRWWDLLREAAGMPDLKRHDLRRNFVTSCRRSGVGLEVAMALSDHTSAQVMMAHYRKVDVTETKRALQAMGK